MSDLVAFLNARLNQDEAQSEDDSWADSNGNCYECGTNHARLLREVEAKRKIVASQTAPYVKGHEPPTVVLKYLAAVYSDHPDYRQEWAHGDS